MAPSHTHVASYTLTSTDMDVIEDAKLTLPGTLRVRHATNSLSFSSLAVHATLGQGEELLRTLPSHRMAKQDNDYRDKSNNRETSLSRIKTASD